MADEEATPRLDVDDDNLGYGTNDGDDENNLSYRPDDDQIQAMNDVFSRFKDDPDSDYINLNRLTEVLQAFGQNPSQRESEQKMTELEMSGKTDLTLEDVVQMLHEPWVVVNNDRDALRQALERFDQTREGYIDIERFRTIMTGLGEPLNDDEFQELIQLGLNEDQTKINIDYLLDQLLGSNA